MTSTYEHAVARDYLTARRRYPLGPYPHPDTVPPEDPASRAALEDVAVALVLASPARRLLMGLPAFGPSEVKG